MCCLQELIQHKYRLLQTEQARARSLERHSDWDAMALGLGRHGPGRNGGLGGTRTAQAVTTT